MRRFLTIPLGVVFVVGIAVMSVAAWLVITGIGAALDAPLPDDLEASDEQ